MKKLAWACGLSMLAAAPAMAAGFVNGNFETGDTTGWTTGGGYRAPVFNNDLNPTDFLPGGARYDGTLNHSAVVGQGVMAHTDGNLQQVYSGNYSFRAEDLSIGGYASAITQTVTNYTDPGIYFAWAATLQGAHGVNDAATFKLVLTNLTSGVDLVTRTYNAANSGSGVDSRFAESTDGFFYTTAWQIESFDVSAFSGDSFALTLLAADCEQTGHMGTVYLDGFGAVTPPPVGAVPEPETYALMLAGLGLVGWVARRRRA
jgi:hypothetical protein